MRKTVRVHLDLESAVDEDAEQGVVGAWLCEKIENEFDGLCVHDITYMFLEAERGTLHLWRCRKGCGLGTLL